MVDGAKPASPVLPFQDSINKARKYGPPNLRIFPQKSAYLVEPKVQHIFFDGNIETERVSECGRVLPSVNHSADTFSTASFT
jgi:uncharacterized metal-binding protein YceD (DUF177 family)